MINYVSTKGKLGRYFEVCSRMYRIRVLETHKELGIKSVLHTRDCQYKEYKKHYHVRKIAVEKMHLKYTSNRK